MAFSLYDATIPTYLQILGAMRGLTEKAETFCAEKNVGEADLLNAHFGADMLPLKWQIKWTSTHSLGSIEGVRKGSFVPDMAAPAESFAGLREQIDSSIAALKQVTPEEIESFIGRDMMFTIGDSLRLDFLAEHFLMSFSLPNFFFHSATAYDLLRDKGLELGKRDFVGMPRIKTPAPA